VQTDKRENLGYGAWGSGGEAMRNPHAFMELHFGMRQGPAESWVPDFTYPIMTREQAIKLRDGLSAFIGDAMGAKIAQMSGGTTEIRYHSLAEEVVERAWPSYEEAAINKRFAPLRLASRPEVFGPIMSQLLPDAEWVRVFWHPDGGRLWAIGGDEGWRLAQPFEAYALDHAIDDLYLVFLPLRGEA
jgi:hypothetical protein